MDVNKIRDEYDEEVPIVLTADIGFFDQVNFRSFEKLGISYVVGGKLYSDIKERVQETSECSWSYLKRRTDESTSSSLLPTDEETGRDYAGRSIPAWSMRGILSPSALLSIEGSITSTWGEVPQSTPP